MNPPTDSGSTLVEVLVSTAVASVALAGAVGLLATSARAVGGSELETTATWVVTRTIEEWRSTAGAALEGQHQLSRSGDRVPGTGILVVDWTARPEAGGTGLWRVVVTISGARLRQTMGAEAVVSRGTP